MRLEEILKEYSRVKNTGKLELNEMGVCRLYINNSLVVSLEKSLDGHGFYIYATIGSLPADKENQTILMALSGNLFGKETGRANIGFSEKTRSLILFEYFEETAMTFEAYLERFEKFVRYVSYWMVKLEKRSKSEEEEYPSHNPPLAVHNMRIFFA